MSPLTAQETKEVAPRTLKLKLAHSPDSDDAFMFYALATRKIPTEGIAFEHTLEDIEMLNRKGLEGVYDVTAISFHGYSYLADQYLLLTSGASFGDGYGPIVVARRRLGRKGLKGRRVAIPGKLTTAALVLRLYEPEFLPVETSFDQILGQVAAGEVDAGVIIHEGQLTYGNERLMRVVDLGEWWSERTGLPLPLGGNAIRRSLDPSVRSLVNRMLRTSIEYGLAHREEALAYAMQFARGLDSGAADKFVSMYVNDWTLDYGERGRLAVQELLRQGFEAGVIPSAIRPEFVE